MFVYISQIYGTVDGQRWCLTRS